MKLVKLAYQKISRVVEQLVFANPGPVVIDKFHASHFANLIGDDKMFLTVADAVSSCSSKLAEQV